MTCQKCNVQLGVMIEDDLGTLCIVCHPTAINTGLEQQEILNKLQNIDFKNVAERVY